MLALKTMISSFFFSMYKIIESKYTTNSAYSTSWGFTYEKGSLNIKFSLSVMFRIFQANPAPLKRKSTSQYLRRITRRSMQLS